MDTAVAPAPTIIAHHNATLAGPFVDVQPTAHVRFDLPAAHVATVAG